MRAASYTTRNSEKLDVIPTVRDPKNGARNMAQSAPRPTRHRIAFLVSPDTPTTPSWPVVHKDKRPLPNDSGLRFFVGGDEGIRTLGPHVANVMLSQLSYIPTKRGAP